MAQVRVGLAQASAGQLPPVCICCGGPATRGVYHKFYYRPTWLVIVRCFMGYLINLAVGAYRNVNLNVPVCERHASRLKLPTYLTYAVLGWLLLGILSSFIAMAVGAGADDNQVGGYVALVFFLTLLPMLIGLVVLQILTPRAEYFDNQLVGLTAVSVQFAQALGQGQFGSMGMPYGAPQPQFGATYPQYGAPQPQYGAPGGFQPYTGFAGPGGLAPQPGGMSAAAEMRTWTDVSGKFRIAAEFVSFDQVTVVLKKADGVTMPIPIAKLCPADQQYVLGRVDWPL